MMPCKFKRDGAVTPWILMSLTVIVGVVAIGMDGGRVMEGRRHAQAVLQGARQGPLAARQPELSAAVLRRRADSGKADRRNPPLGLGRTPLIGHGPLLPTPLLAAGLLCELAPGLPAASAGDRLSGALRLIAEPSGALVSSRRRAGCPHEANRG